MKGYINMIFTVDKDEFEKAIIPVSIVAQNKSSEASLSGVYMEAKDNKLVLYCYDIERGIRTEIDADVKKEGCIIADYQIVPIIHSLNGGEVYIEVDDNYIINIKNDESELQIMGRDGSSYPKIPEVRGFSSFTISRRQLKNVISKTMFAVSDDESKPILKGSLFEISDGKLTVSAIDGFRFTVRTEKSTVDKSDLNVSFILPGKAEQNLLRIIDDSDDNISCELANKHIIFVMDNLYILIRLLEGDFPSYQKFIPQYDVKAVVDKQELIASLERVNIINAKKKTSAKLTFVNDQLKIFCKTDLGQVSDVISVYMEGDPIEANFNQSYLLDALRACDDEKVVLRVAGQGRGLVIVAREEDEKDDSSYLQLVMPVRAR